MILIDRAEKSKLTVDVDFQKRGYANSKTYLTLNTIDDLGKLQFHQFSFSVRRRRGQLHGGLRWRIWGGIVRLGVGGFYEMIELRSYTKIVAQKFQFNFSDFLCDLIDPK